MFQQYKIIIRTANHLHFIIFSQQANVQYFATDTKEIFIHRVIFIQLNTVELHFIHY